jgi:signal transduction histidine kinase/FixJ family two-component response regulator
MRSHLANAFTDSTDRRRSLIALILLAIVGYAGNCFPIPIVYSVDFIFGSIATSIAVRLYGTNWGVLVAAIVSLHTLVLWKHPYAIFIFTAEALWVGWGLRHKSQNLLLLDTLYWGFLGIPLVWLFYGGILGFETSSVWLVALKQGVNGIFNALIASLLLTNLPLYRWAARSQFAKTLSFEQTLLNLLVAFVFIPTLCLIVLDSRDTTARKEAQIATNLQAAATHIANALGQWYQINDKSLQELAIAARRERGTDKLPAQVLLAQRISPALQDLYITDANDRPIVATSEMDRQNFSALANRSPNTSNSPVEIIRTADKLTLFQSVPIGPTDRPKGYMIAQLDSRFLLDLLQAHTFSVSIHSILLDDLNRVILSTSPDFPPGQVFDRDQSGKRKGLDTEMYYWEPTGMPMLARRNRAFYGQTAIVSEDLPWKVAIETPLRPTLVELNQLYINNLATLLLIAVSAVVLAHLTSRRFVRPIWQLAQLTTNLPNNLLKRQEIAWPTSRVMEMNALTGNFQQMARTLEQKFQELQQASNQIQQAKDTADRANLAKSDFLASMSHELRTPLNGILGYAQILQASSTLTPKERKGVKTIERCGVHLLALINEVLDLSKIEAGKMELNPSAIDLPQLLTEIVDVCQIRAEQKAIDLIYVPSPQLPARVLVDEKRLRQVSINLLGNAIKFTDRGEVTFRVDVTRQEEQEIDLRFQVEDTGVGIDPAQLETIFLPFEQAGDSDRQTEGTGLGLNISQKILHLMGSSLQVRSQLGRGSTFWFEVTLPVLAQSTALANEVNGGECKIVGYVGRQRTILVVDDREDNRSVLVNLLEPLGFKVVEASDGLQGLDRAIAIHPDAILTDRMMPILDGLEMTQRLRQLPDTAEVPIAICSASISASDRQQSLEAGANAFLPKPVQLSALLEVLEGGLGLEWVRDQSSMAQQHLSATTAQMVVPGQDELAHLYDLAHQGRILALRKQIAQLEQSDAQLLPFVGTIKDLADRFQVEKIQQLIAQYLR